VTRAILTVIVAVLVLDVGFLLGAWWASRGKDDVLGSNLSPRWTPPEDLP
jgi:hypothetical protein